MSLKISNLKVTVADQEIIHGLNLEINVGEVHAIMGPNGSGKSTLANTLMGHPKYSVTVGNIVLDGENVTTEKPNIRAQKGLFLSMQYPPEIEGVTIANFLRVAKNALTGINHNPLDFHKELLAKMAELNIDPAFARRHLNAGFSGGEKKRVEILQLAVLDPKYAILDETDSGLDVDALRIVADGINRFRGTEKGILLITHYNRILEYVTPNFVHIMSAGKIVKSGGAELAEEVEKNGYVEFLVN
ncbi:MAG: Fe-S cluster assembly ATPase SufC [Candidatus Magasanikbacteria bacterium RIFCSPHIGHO2_01_FULL_41_23]|uniref:Fe-S cluster assembly ATPase SufC n=1 Tax=Candidatus Magasanikbacteria bacterium RIFCSPLOWO2_01_FULL_40_15 TaxID=1798686 RepID=A0A1F6N3E4_9BACT|nr:MAG: Fe-S cluster assembly ATPase SufC [Candidatus Magasanikbacteria bacterium RIFCSPHIGHO2_01_FULL_41_23]OGH67357.1 MAG: Fe-S cluster assembly ATPase SufC [Candidatus Magasanikbacteria bacterium RIFCSPHIGHO2_02_FULL_41_35]OGH74603.1 MAG: Fe-S cluster assembly ATPase SufC [Candidatus Magasanikbacteria bacterium RIFCSPHIGHO2_12_FULL_41_16]OGH78437.1 MAG: Fe-S cluster assembly ATPase SufC [Candidatus Magasanikbacteria bacterium RIFCSPLOWO2_01_FULL_40_15]